VLETIGQPQKTPQKAVGDLEIAKKISDFTGKPLSTTAQGTMTTNHHENDAVLDAFLYLINIYLYNYI
jgi:hypothetical protein